MRRDSGPIDDDQSSDPVGDRYQMLFENNPIVIWEHDFSEAKSYLDSLSIESTDVEAYLNSHPPEVAALFDNALVAEIVGES